MGDIAREKREALEALADMEATVLRAAPRPGEVRLQRDTMLDLLRKFRGWVEAFPEPGAFRHSPYRPPHQRKQTQP